VRNSLAWLLILAVVAGGYTLWGFIDEARRKKQERARKRSIPFGFTRCHNCGELVGTGSPGCPHCEAHM